MENYGIINKLQSSSKMLERLPFFTFLVLVPPAPGSMLDKTKLFLCVIVVTCPNIEQGARGVFRRRTNNLF